MTASPHAVSLPPTRRPDAVNALVVLTTAGCSRAAVLTSDPDDIAAYAATLPKASIAVVPV